MSRYAMQFTDEHRRKGTAVRLGLTLTAYNAHIEAGEKWCGGCRAWHPREAFGPHRGRWDGLQAYCRRVKNAYMRDWQRELHALTRRAS